MLQAAVSLPVRATRAPRREAHAPQATLPLVSIEVTVPGTSSAAGRRALHAALGDDLRLYVVTIDNRRDCVTFRVEVASRPLDEVIAALARTLDAAVIGRALCTRTRRTARQ